MPWRRGGHGHAFGAPPELEVGRHIGANIGLGEQGLEVLVGPEWRFLSVEGPDFMVSDSFVGHETNLEWIIWDACW